MMLVADALRLGGAILSEYPDMLASQLVGRLLPERSLNHNVCALLDLCDQQGPDDCALLPTYHCLHTPGGPLKYSLEGHQFAVFGFRLTADLRYIVSVSNKFITWDLSTSDLFQTVVINLMTSEFVVVENPHPEFQLVGTQLSNNRLVVYSQAGFVVYDIRGQELERVDNESRRQVISMKFISQTDYSVMYLEKDDEPGTMSLETVFDGKQLEPVSFNSALVFDPRNRERLFTCLASDLTVSVLHRGRLKYTEKERLQNDQPLLQMDLGHGGDYLIATFMQGFKIWELTAPSEKGVERAGVTLLLPYGIRNVTSKPMQSNSCVLSLDKVYAVAGVRKSLYIWSVETQKLMKVLDAHFGRIIHTTSLTIGTWNSVITSSLDRTVKVWNINNIFEKVYHIDRHEMQVDSISLSQKRDIAVTVARSCVGIWHLKLGKLLCRLADSPLGAIVTHAQVTADGRYIINTESGIILIWEVSTGQVIFRAEVSNVKQLTLFDKDCKFFAVSKGGVIGDAKCTVSARTIPHGELLYSIEYPIRLLRNVVVTTDQQLIVLPGCESLKDTLFVHNATTGALVNRVVLKYPNYKDFHHIVVIPKKATQIALIDSDKGNILDMRTRRFLRSVPRWNGCVTKDGRYGLFAPGRGGLEVMELKHGTTVKTLIPRVAEGVFSVITMFTKTDEYVLYYHSGRKTLRVFRLKDGHMVANYRVSAELTSIASSDDGRSVVLGTLDGCVTCLTIADAKKAGIHDYVQTLPSRSAEAWAAADAAAREVIHIADPHVTEED